MEPARAAPVAAHDHRPSAAKYEGRRPEGTVLHQVVSEHWGAFVEHAEEQGRPLPSFVQREVEAYLRCGMLEHGLLRLGCPACGFERLVAFSCKKRGFCPSCLGRRMTDIACHLRERVLPEVPLRQWVCSLPWELRALRPRAGQPPLRLVDPSQARRDEPIGIVGGFNVHAARTLHGAGHAQVERFCRYLARPPIAQDRVWPSHRPEWASADRRACPCA